MSDKYGELIGCDEMHYADVMSDTAEQYQAGPMKYLAPTAEISHETTVNTNKRYYDNAPRFVNVTEGDTKVNITISGVPCDLAADLTGKPYNSSTGEFYDTGSTKDAGYKALSGRMSLGDGGYRYFNYLKGKFAIGAQKARTVEDNITVNTVDLTYEPVITTHKFQVESGKVSGVKGVFADTTDEHFSKANTWFNSIVTPPEVETVNDSATQEQSV